MKKSSTPKRLGLRPILLGIKGGHAIQSTCHCVRGGTEQFSFLLCRRLQHHPRFITIRYEDLVARPDEIQQELMDRMPSLNKRAEFSEYHLRSAPSARSRDALGGVRAISSSSIGNWHNHLPRVAGQLRIHGSISDDLVEYGYESDDSWQRELEGIVPDLRASHWPEQFADQRLRPPGIIGYLKAAIVMLGHLPVTGALLRTLFKDSPR